jgi:RNA polymerase sigma factor (sigma-70 family)
MTAIYSPAVSPEAGPVPPAPAGGILRETLGGLDDQELLSIVGSLEATSRSRARARELLVARYRRLVYSSDPRRDERRHLEVSGEDLREAQRAELAFRPSSLDAPLPGPSGTATFADVLGAEDHAVEHMLAIQAVAAHWGELAPREQRILRMRFHDDMTQAQIGQQLGLSQMHVSRLSTHALRYLRQRVLS